MKWDRSSMVGARRFVFGMIALLGLWGTTGWGAPPHISAANHNALPEGETITLTGTNLAGVTQARMLWASLQFPTTATSVSDVEAQVVMPNVFQDIRDHYLLLESADGATIALPINVVEHTGTGPVVGNPHPQSPVVVKAGAVLTQVPRVHAIVVESGGVLEVDTDSILTFILAEDNAVVDFSVLVGSMDRVAFFYGSNTTVIGSIPSDGSGGTIGEQFGSIQPSYDVGTFTVGYPINITVVGNGSVVTDPDRTYFSRFTDVTLTAVPGTNATFSGWSGGVVSADNPLSVVVETSPISLTATFASGWVLDVYEPPGATVTRSPDVAVFTNGQSVMLSATVDPGYEFLGWAGDAIGVATNTSLIMDTNMVVFPMVRPFGYDTLPQVIGADHLALPEGEVTTLGQRGQALEFSIFPTSSCW